MALILIVLLFQTAIESNTHNRQFDYNDALEPTPLYIQATSERQNSFRLCLTDRDESTQLHFANPIPLQVKIDNSEPVLYHPEQQEATTLILSDEKEQSYSFGEISLPSQASESYTMVISASETQNLYNIQPLTISVQVRCTDPEKLFFMECFLNCGEWLIEW